MLIGNYPFNGEEVRDVASAIKKGRIDIPHFVSEEARDLISKILNKDPVLRISIKEIK
jgi:serine/threonine protein kinase